jgi:hypothetical protein
MDSVPLADLAGAIDEMPDVALFFNRTDNSQQTFVERNGTYFLKHISPNYVSDFKMAEDILKHVRPSSGSTLFVVPNNVYETRPQIMVQYYEMGEFMLSNHVVEGEVDSFVDKQEIRLRDYTAFVSTIGGVFVSGTEIVSSWQLVCDEKKFVVILLESFIPMAWYKDDVKLHDHQVFNRYLLPMVTLFLYGIMEDVDVSLAVKRQNVLLEDAFDDKNILCLSTQATQAIKTTQFVLKNVKVLLKQEHGHYKHGENFCITFSYKNGGNNLIRLDHKIFLHSNTHSLSKLAREIRDETRKSGPSICNDVNGGVRCFMNQKDAAVMTQVSIHVTPLPDVEKPSKKPKIVTFVTNGPSTKRHNHQNKPRPVPLVPNDHDADVRTLPPLLAEKPPRSSLDSECIPPVIHAEEAKECYECDNRFCESDIIFTCDTCDKSFHEYCHSSAWIVDASCSWHCHVCFR